MGFLRNRIYKQAKAQSRRLLNNPAKALAMIKQGLEKAKSAQMREQLEDKIANGQSRLNLMGRMLKAYFNGDYTRIPKGVILKMLATMLYFVWVADAIPDFIVGIGFIDDATLIAWLFNAIGWELEQFRAWEENEAEVSPDATDYRG